MDDAAVEDETKPFDAENAPHDEDSQPDPNESLMMDAGNGRVWLVKVHAQLNPTPFPCLIRHRSRGT